MRQIYIPYHYLLLHVLLKMSMVRALVEPHSHFPWDSQTYSLRNQSILDAGQHMVHKALGKY